MKPADAINILEGYIKAMSSGNFDKATSFMDEKLVYEDVATGKVFHGIKDHIDFARKLRVELPYHTWEPQSSFSDGNKVACECLWKTTIPPSLKPEDPGVKMAVLKTVTIAEIRHGKIYHASDYYDLSILKQIGGPPPDMKA
jgi:hypothetical protein